MLETLPVRDVAAPEPEASASDESPLVRKIARHVALRQMDRDALGKILGANVRVLQPRTTFIENGAPLAEVSIILDGWACSYTRIGARRQIVAFHLPGDICNLDAFLLGRSDQAIASIGTLRIAGIGRSTLNLLARRCPKASHGLLRESARAAATQRRWTLNVGQRGAKERIAYLLCELWARMEAVGLADRTGADLPLSQPDIADACGLTPEHTNRTLQELRALGLFTLEDRRLNVRDLDRARALAGIDHSASPETAV